MIIYNFFKHNTPNYKLLELCFQFKLITNNISHYFLMILAESSVFLWQDIHFIYSILIIMLELI